jgi:septal ring factor EnvC (AmiA/AmiB activator)
VSRAAAGVLSAYRAGLADLERLQAASREKAERLRAVESAGRADREKIVVERRERRRVFDRLAGEIRKSRREINVLRADEARLARLVEALGRLLYAKVEKAPERGAQASAFSVLRGKLRLPVKGELTGRFGAPRGASGTESKGLFIRAAEGQPVRAVGRGRVVYADWMRGFGNVMIVDHGEHYLSIYANNEALLKQVGEDVDSGESIATTGSSGGNEETGLYFEMRHLGRAFDPLRWVQLR